MTRYAKKVKSFKKKKMKINFDTDECFNTYEVEKILNKKKDSIGEIFYLIKWRFYATPSWERASNVINCEELIRNLGSL
jgi:hypothetical protein